MVIHSNSVYAQNQSDPQNCEVLSSDVVKIFECGVQLVPQGFAYTDDRNASMVNIGEFAW